jgi:hypothetical protein
MGLLFTFPSRLPFVAALAYVVLGLFFALAGAPAYRASPKGYGAVLGAAVGLALGGLAAHPAALALAPLVGGVLGAMSARPFTAGAVILTGGLAGAGLVVYPIAAVFPDSKIPECSAGLIGLLLGGTLAARYEHAVLATLTALWGTVLAGAGLNGVGVEALYLGPRAGDFVASTAGAALRVAVFAAGIAIQLSLARRRADEVKPTPS